MSSFARLSISSSVQSGLIETWPVVARMSRLLGHISFEYSTCLFASKLKGQFGDSLDSLGRTVYDGYKVHQMYDFLSENGMKMIDELLIKKQ